MACLSGDFDVSGSGNPLYNTKPPLAQYGIAQVENSCTSDLTSRTALPSAAEERDHSSCAGYPIESRGVHMRKKLADPTMEKSAA
jgi:hypothetical protein